MADVGAEGQHRNAGDGERADRLAHGRMVDADQADAARRPLDAVQPLGERIGVEALDHMDTHPHVAAQPLLLGEAGGEQMQKGVGAARHEEVEIDDVRHVAELGGEPAALQIAEPPGDREHPVAGPLAHAEAVVEHAVDGRGRDTGLAGDIGKRRSRHGQCGLPVGRNRRKLALFPKQRQSAGRRKANHINDRNDDDHIIPIISERRHCVAKRRLKA